MKSGKTDLRKKPTIGEREALWIALSAQSMRMVELLRIARGVTRLLKRFEKRLEKVEGMLRFQRCILDELPDIVRDEIASRRR